jgi:hypothetical protein
MRLGATELARPPFYAYLLEYLFQQVCSELLQDSLEDSWQLWMLVHDFINVDQMQNFGDDLFQEWLFWNDNGRK